MTYSCHSEAKRRISSHPRLRGGQNNPEIHSRVQQVVLVEEDVLTCAIEQKFQKLMVRKQAREDTFGEAASNQIVRDHLQKLFISHLRLPTLSRAHNYRPKYELGCCPKEGGGHLTEPLPLKFDCRRCEMHVLLKQRINS